ncbi:thioredoxin-T [Drosophila sechellia]|uniref:GM12651 n=1 Tax=Drosophila sechellia TaxID=7238 RepID=B4I0R2_DROSE|nr:thioredoxin-T [Drosophila sechellia]XP_032580957.1 thioredoxin-T [Drosophila sechellia]XP_032580958.1 thioredoxin-T [Drosophila sechellia]XP_032580960.1 thioredoxin-T [Drosophila sechellia]EDW53093.1 GM12651 [Drosophila sechellia]
MVYIVHNKDDLDQQLTLAEDKLVVIDFYADWCGPCKIIAPKLEELAEQYSDRVVVLKVNVDENEDITVEYKVNSMPTFVFIKGGDVLELLVGCNSDKLAKLMEEHAGVYTSCVEDIIDDESIADENAACSDSDNDNDNTNDNTNDNYNDNDDDADVIFCEVSAHDEDSVLEH